MSLMGSIWSQYVIFGENGQNWVILGSKMKSKVNIWENLSKNVTLKVYKKADI